MECLTCKAIRGEERISPGPPIRDSTYWVVEHAYPVKIAGWLVLVLKRHAEALHELTEMEFAELQLFFRKAIRLLHDELGCEKEYVLQLAEAPGHKHVHFHIVPISKDLPKEVRGRNILDMKKSGKGQIPEEEVRALCERLKQKF